MDRLSICFGNSTHGEGYWKREKAKYLMKGERLDEPILNNKKDIILEAVGVARIMWDNTHIFVESPTRATNGREQSARCLVSTLYPRSDFL